MGKYSRIRARRRSGKEPFHSAGRKLGFNLLSFWKWSASDVVSNATRGVLAEYLVARAIGVGKDVRDEWAAYDLRDSLGITIEVKSAAYIQSWYQDRLSSITFSCGKTFAWDPDTNQLGTEKRRHAQVYVFALLAHKDQESLDPLDVSQWEFYVVPTVRLDERTRSQHSITLPTLRSLVGEPVTYFDLKKAVGDAGNWQPFEEAKAEPGLSEPVSGGPASVRSEQQP